MEATGTASKILWKCSKWLEKDFETWLFFCDKWVSWPLPLVYDICHKKVVLFFEGFPKYRQYKHKKGLSYSWINKVVNANNFTGHYSSDTDSSGESEVFINNANHGFVTQLCQNSPAVCLGRLGYTVNLWPTNSCYSWWHLWRKKQSFYRQSRVWGR